MQENDLSSSLSVFMSHLDNRLIYLKFVPLNDLMVDPVVTMAADYE